MGPAVHFAVRKTKLQHTRGSVSSASAPLWMQRDRNATPSVLAIPYSRILPSTHPKDAEVQSPYPSPRDLLAQIYGPFHVWPTRLKSSLQSWLPSPPHRWALGRVTVLECGVLLGQFSSASTEPAVQRAESQAVG